MDEFFIIDKYFRRSSKIGDDAALISVPTNQELVVSADAMVEGVHFLPGDNPYTIGHKLVAVNLSDMAAMGATPKYATLTIAMSKIDESWLLDFSRGIFDLADKYKLEIVGGDITKAPNYYLAMQIIGEVPTGMAITRAGASIGDEIYLSGSLGASAFYLDKKLAGEKVSDFNKHDLPEPNIELGLEFRNIASSMIDISDGLLADLQHILDLSKVGAEINFDLIPVAKELENIKKDQIYNYVLTSGEEYELLFTVPAKAKGKLQSISDGCGIKISKIGQIIKGRGVMIDGILETGINPGYKHFE